MSYCPSATRARTVVRTSKPNGTGPNGTGREAAGLQNPILTSEPAYVGDPILAVAAVDEKTAEDAIEAINFEFEPLPFVIDPLTSLHPDGDNARTQGNVGNSSLREEIRTVNWSLQDFAEAGEDKLPLGEAAREWTYGDLDTGFGNAAFTLDESFVTASHSHNSMEPRSVLSYWGSRPRAG